MENMLLYTARSGCLFSPCSKLINIQAAIAAAISLRSYLLVSFLPKSNRTISLVSPDIDLDHTWNIEDLPWDARFGRNQKNQYLATLDLELVEALQPHINAVSPTLPEHTRKIHRSSAFAFLYLLLSLSSPGGLDACTYTVRSNIPVGAGLGSSASLSVCFATALLLQSKALRPPAPHPARKTGQQIDLINRWAFVAETCIHGNPSGVDNTVASGGKAVLYQRKDPLKAPTVLPLRRFPELPLLVVDTRESRSATERIAAVRALRAEAPVVVDAVMGAVDAATRSAYRLISARGRFGEEAVRRLGQLVAINHGLLVALGVSHPKLDRVSALVGELDVGWAKLTGAGGGGCAIVLLKPDSHSAMGQLSDGEDEGEGEGPLEKMGLGSRKLVELKRMLADEGMEMLETTLAGDGAGVLWPAVLRIRSGDEERVVDIDGERFLGTQGKEAIEKLVGVNATAASSDSKATVADKDGWRFWRR